MSVNQPNHMHIDRFVIETMPTAQDVQFLEERLHEHNDAQTGMTDGKWLAIFLRDDQDMIRAGISGWAWGGCGYIRYLWVHEALRGQGYGKQLMQTAEQEAVARGCFQMILETHSFQAPAFYQKLGYEVIAVLDDYPRGHKNYSLRKRFT